ncbi:uncharacterized protein LOC143244746 [Tachypleus tridentatus]|uniref:uncharacterized protein LOC143244746 n=1 Tax=Tachypleus tridentatus TaxID=6853 RepID=UPI003FD679BF
MSASIRQKVLDWHFQWQEKSTSLIFKKRSTGWYRGEKRVMKFATPRTWREPIDHSSNCYFCTVDPSKCQADKNASTIMYSDLPSSNALVPHCPELPIPTPPDT